ncbi:MAG: D-2-hydroxyacid dehydrogenase [Opitutaceae bacterium]|nr:D-2-hydroxyacid dehydrogenase [Opitutaceae bacterium]
MRIIVAVAGLVSAQKLRLSAALAGHEVGYVDVQAAPDQARAAVTEAEIIFGNVPAGWLAGATRLRWVQLDSAGVDAYLGLNAARPGAPVQLTNLSDFYGRAVAEVALASILAFYRQLPRLMAGQREGRWVKTEVEPGVGQLHGAPVLVLGTGAIGRRLMTLLRAFECEVRGFARRSADAQLHTLAELDAALPSAAVVINTLPHTPETQGLLGRERLARFAPSALLVNVGRGSAVDEAALVEALDAGRLGGAVLDVTQVEPLPAASPLWQHPRVILTQHTGGRFPRESEAKIDVFLGNFARFTRGEPLSGAVDPSRGY